MDKNEMLRLMENAREAKKNSYSPYSKFSVGAALLSKNGKIYTGCNVENSAYTPTCCAERVAIFSAVADGCRELSAIAISGDSAPCMPCGVCRQAMSEFFSEETPVIFENEDGSIESLPLSELLPYSFKLKENK